MAVRADRIVLKRKKDPTLAARGLRWGRYVGTVVHTVSSVRQQFKQSSHLNREFISNCRDFSSSCAALAENVGKGGDFRSESGTGCGFGHGVGTYAVEFVAQPGSSRHSTVAISSNESKSILSFMVHLGGLSVHGRVFVDDLRLAFDHGRLSPCFVGIPGQLHIVPPLFVAVVAIGQHRSTYHGTHSDDYSEPQTDVDHGHSPKTQRRARWKLSGQRPGCGLPGRHVLSA